ncbi:2-keto-4-pentenoate hydratase [Novosphingobium rosa]|uniref:2-keto-4-pentenoate hydratase n=1 Tax=Novosphingobium rosa TaxID=76978 RepID=UPI0008360F1C|nr:fumarylacetoacetate hydrolase family protein [Novosphingobium rosa]
MNQSAESDGLPPIAARFVAARRAAQGLSRWPAGLPRTLDEAYGIQSSAQAAWSARAGGVKVGRVLGAWEDALRVDRFIGPISADTIRHVGAGEIGCFPVIDGGTALLECEIVVVLGQDAPDARSLGERPVLPSEIRSLTAGLHIGIEIAGSPMADINALGPLASIACFGNNNGALVGPAIAGWQDMDLTQIPCVASIDGIEVGRGDTSRLPGGIWQALAFAATQAARLGCPLRAGDVVCTGALTGMHPIGPGARARADFGPLGQVDCLTVVQQGRE